VSKWDDEDSTAKHLPSGASAAPSSVLELVRLARTNAGEVAATMAEMCLVGPKPPGGEDDWSFRTASLRTVRQKVGDSDVIVDEGFLVFPIKKTKTGPFATTVLVGRSASNDVAVPHSSVSKLHARISIKPDGLYLSDAGSSNGTVVNARKLRPSEEVKLASGDLILFGACPYVVLDAASLHAILQRFAAM
jgi:hypothetical protein